MGAAENEPLVPPPERSPLEERLRAVPLRLADEAGSVAGDVIALSARAARLDGLRAQLALVNDEVKASAGELMHRQRLRRFHLEGLATITTGGGVKRANYRHLELATALMHAVSRQHGGELHPRDVLHAILDCAGIVFWRAEALDRYGVDIDLFCDKADGHTIYVSNNLEVPG